jgi:DNA-binding transcriptional LysR family regulator
MEDLRQYAIFAQVVIAGSMSAAARRLGMTPSAVSQTIRTLEARVGVLLLRRSTRKLSLTEAGERCLPYCLRLVEAGDAAATSLEQARDAPEGEIRISAPAGFGRHVAPALGPVLADWPALKLRLIVDDSLVDLIDARIDVAIRVGNLPDSTWIGRKLCDFDQVLCASPAYLERRGAPGDPDGLGVHDFLRMSGTGAVQLVAHEGPETIRLHLTGSAGTATTIVLAARVSTTGQVALQQMCEQGLGVAVLPYPDVSPTLERGALVRIMAGWRLPILPVTMVVPRTDRDTAKARVVGDALKRYFAKLPRSG